MGSVLQIRGVSKSFGKKEVLKDVDLDIYSGEIFGIIGMSGAGKTTLLRILFGAERPTLGEVIIDGVNILQYFGKIYQLRRSMGIVFQDAKLLEDRSVSDNVALTLEVTGQWHKKSRTRISEILEQVGLEGRGGDRILALSAGERQRVAIARALVNNPPLLLVDEPLGNLDAESADQVMQIFGHFHRKGTTILFATHDTQLVEHYPHRTIHLLAGRLVDRENTVS